MNLLSVCWSGGNSHDYGVLFYLVALTRVTLLQLLKMQQCRLLFLLFAKAEAPLLALLHYQAKLLQFARRRCIFEGYTTAHITLLHC